MCLRCLVCSHRMNASLWSITARAAAALAYSARARTASLADIPSVTTNGGKEPSSDPAEAKEETRQGTRKGSRVFQYWRHFNRRQRGWTHSGGKAARVLLRRTPLCDCRSGVCDCERPPAAPWLYGLAVRVPPDRKAKSAVFRPPDMPGKLGPELPGMLSEAVGLETVSKGLSLRAACGEAGDSQ